MVMLNTGDLEGRCKHDLEVVVHAARRSEQGDQAQLDVGAVAVGNVFLIGSRGHQLVVMAASPLALLGGCNLLMFVSTAEADDDTSLETTEHALKHDGRKDKTGCDTKTHVWGSIRRSRGGVQCLFRSLHWKVPASGKGATYVT